MRETEGLALPPSSARRREAPSTDKGEAARRSRAGWGLNTYSVTTTGTAKTFEYDGNGNLRFEKQPNGTVLREYRWDQQNRLVKAIVGTHESAYEYDGADRRWRITEKESGVQTKQETFVWCGSRICQKRGSNGTTVVRSYFGEGFEESGPTKYFYARDHLGSVREVVGGDGATVASRLAYDPWGKVTESGSGPLSDLTYTGHYADRATGLNAALYRAYDANLGRWVAMDPIGLQGGLNLYGYVGNEPTGFTDPSGLDPFGAGDELAESQWDATREERASWVQNRGLGAGLGLAGLGAWAAGSWALASSGLRVVGGTATNWIGLAGRNGQQLIHIGRHPLAHKELVSLFGRTLAGVLRPQPLTHIGIAGRHFPLNPILYIRAMFALLGLVEFEESQGGSCPANP